MKHIKRNHKGKERSRFLLSARFIFFATAFLLFTVGHSQTIQNQVFTDWTSPSGSQNSFQKSKVKTATIGGVVYSYVVGATLNSSGNFDILTERFSPGGGLMWAAVYDGPASGNDIGTDIAITPNGEVYVSGTEYESSGDSSDAIVLKYDANGNYRWRNIYNGGGSRNDGYSSLLASGTVVVATGAAWSSSNMYDMLTRRLDTAGTTTWTTLYDNVSLNDGGVSLASRSGSIFVTGGSQSATTTYKIAVWKINPATGAITTTTLSSGSAFGIDEVTDIQEDASSNVYVCGGVYDVSTGYDFKVFKFDANLSLLWSHTWDGTNSLDDIATGLYVDSLGAVIVTGSSRTTANGLDYATVKYNSSGTQQWAQTFDQANKNDSATSIVTSGTDIYVTGASDNGTGYDYYTIKYNSSGTKLWGISYNSTGNHPDLGLAIALDTLGAVVVTGQSGVPGAMQYVTIKYAQAQVIVPPDTAVIGSNAFEFTENRGQLRNLSFVSDLKAQYYCQATTPEVYFQNGSSTSFLMTKVDTIASTTDSLVQVDMSFNGANSVKAYAFNPGNDYCAYYLAHLSEPAIRIKNFQNIIYPGLYTDIDLEFGSHAGGLKYSFIIKPGGDPTDIDFSFAGASSVSMSGSSVRIATLLGNIDLPQAAAFQIDGSGNFVSLGWQPAYSISSGHVTFTSLGSYDATKPLIFAIRIGTGNSLLSANGNLEFCSYGGTTSDDYFFDACEVFHGEVAVGSSMADLFPGSAGNHGGSYGGGQDGIIAFYENDLLQFRSYIGGNGTDIINAVVLDGNYANHTRVFFAGNSNSNGMMTFAPATGGAYYQSTRSGTNDAIIGDMYVDNFFQMPWFTYFGGSSGYEVINDIAWDNGNLYFTGVGVSGSPLATETGAYNSSSGTTLLGKFNSNDSLTWSTRFGTSTGESIFHYNGALAIAGETSTSDLPMFHPLGSDMDTVRNGMDAIVARFNASDYPTWATYYGGTAGEYGYGVTIDHNNDIYACGSTGSSDFPFKWQHTANGLIDSTNSGGDAFMLKFNSSGQKYWASMYGGSLTEVFYDVAIDSLNNAYFIGTTSSSTCPYLYSGNPYYTGTQFYNQDFIGDNLANSAYGDGIIVMINPALDERWGTFFGGNNPDQIFGGSISATYPQKLIVAGGATSTTSFPWYGANAINAHVGNNGTSDGWEARFTLTDMNILSVQQLTANVENDFLLYPNPGSGQITVQLKSGTEKPQTLTVFNSVGQIVYSLNHPEMDSSGKINLDLSTLGSGIYFINLQYSGKTESNKFSIIR